MSDTYLSSPVSLPPEIWYHIASFIPLQELQQTKLYALNPPLLAFYLRKKYKKLPFSFSCGAFYSDDPHRLSRRLDHLNSMTSGNVRTLTVYFSEYPFSSGYGGSRRPFVRLMGRIIDILRRKRRPTTIESKIASLQTNFPSLQQMRSALSELDSLNAIECTLVCQRHSPIIDFERLLPFAIGAAFHSSRNTLTSLSLTIRLATFPDLGLSAVTFPNLEKFELTTFPMMQYQTPVEDADFQNSLNISAGSLIRFLGRHTHVLSSLSFKFSSKAQSFAADVLSQMSAIPSLCDLRLALELDGVTTLSQLSFGLFKILESNSASLKKLTLCHTFCYPRYDVSSEMYRSYWDWWMSQSFLNVRLTQLDSLSLDFYHHALVFQYISHAEMALTVKSLNVESQVMESDVQRLANIFANNRGKRQIETLSLCFHIFTPAILACLAHGFPNIKTLRLRFIHIGMEENSPYNTETFLAAYEGFSQVMYADWSLESIFLFEPIPEWHHMGELFRAAMVRALPGVKYFNNMKRDDYPSKGVGFY